MLSERELNLYVPKQGLMPTIEIDFHKFEGEKKKGKNKKK
jgi:hypothetical protein